MDCRIMRDTPVNYKHEALVRQRREADLTWMEGIDVIQLRGGS